MAQFIFPDEGERLIYAPGERRGTALTSAKGLEVTVWTAATDGALATITTPDDEAIAGSLLVVDDESLLPRFKGPDGVTVLYLEVAGADIRHEIHAAAFDRLDKGDGGGSGVLVVDMIMDLENVTDALWEAFRDNPNPIQPGFFVAAVNSGTPGVDGVYEGATTVPQDPQTWQPPVRVGDIEASVVCGPALVNDDRILTLGWAPRSGFFISTDAGDHWDVSTNLSGGQRGTEDLTPLPSSDVYFSTSVVSVVSLPEPAGALQFFVDSTEGLSSPFVGLIVGDHLPTSDYDLSFTQDGTIGAVVGQEYLSHPYHRHLRVDGVPNGTSWDITITPLDGFRMAGLDTTQDFANTGDIPAWDDIQKRWGIRSAPRNGARVVESVVESITVGQDTYDFDVWDISDDRSRDTYYLMAPDTPKSRCVLRLPSYPTAGSDGTFTVVVINAPVAYEFWLDFDPEGMIPYSFDLLTPIAGGGLIGYVKAMPTSAYPGENWPRDPWAVIPWDNSSQVVMRPVYCNDTVTYVGVEGGRITDSVYVIQPAQPGQNALLALPPARNHPGESVLVLSADGAQSAAVAEVDPNPTAGRMQFSDLFGALATSVGGEGTIDLTSATLGHDYVSRFIVDGVEYVTDPIDQSFFITPNDGYAAITELYAALVPSAVYSLVDMPSPENGGTMTSLTVGSTSEVRFADGQESIAGVDLVTITAAVPGYDGVIRTIDGAGGALGFAQALPGYPIISGGGTHNHTNNARANQRAIHCWAIPAELNGGEAKWSAEQFPLRDTDLEIGYGPTRNQDGNLIAWQSALNQQLMGWNTWQTPLGDGTYRLTMTISNGEAQLLWVEDP